MILWLISLCGRSNFLSCFSRILKELTYYHRRELELVGGEIWNGVSGGICFGVFAKA
jgi:hypothetical protein